MDDSTLMRKLNQIVKLSQELDDEAKRRFSEGWIFAEADGGLHFMSGDADVDREGMSARHRFIQMSAKGIHRIGVGAW